MCVCVVKMSAKILAYGQSRLGGFGVYHRVEPLKQHQYDYTTIVNFAFIERLVE